MLPALTANRRMMSLHLRVSAKINLQSLLPTDPHLRAVQEDLSSLVSP